MTQRREFLKHASLLAVGTMSAGRLEAQELPQVQGSYDMSWTAKVTGKYRMAFDAPALNGTSLHQVRSFLAGYGTVYGLTDAELSAVLIVRHANVPMVLGDALWADAPWGEKEGPKDPATGEDAKRNPFINVPADAEHATTWPDGTLDKLMARGVIVLACDLALGNAAGGIARRRKIPMQDAQQLVTEHLIPGVYRMPSGIFATCHAQGVGCGMMYAGD